MTKQVYTINKQSLKDFFSNKSGNNKACYQACNENWQNIFGEKKSIGQMFLKSSFRGFVLSPFFKNEFVLRS
jgi:hypothetical protein